MKMPSLPLNYKTSQTKLPLFTRLFPTLVFYYTLLLIILKAGHAAKKGNYPTERWVQDSYDTVKSVEIAGGKVDVDGMEHFTATQGPCVFVANHMSTLETFCLPIFIQPYKDVTYIVKSSLASYPVFGHVMRTRNPILLDRVNPREDLVKSLSEGQKILESGRSLIIFPQGTRKDVFNEQDFNSLGVKLAKKANVPVVPIALKTDLLQKGKTFKNAVIFKDLGAVDLSKTVYFHFGKALMIEGNGKEEHQYCLDFIKNKLDAWHAEDASRAKKA